MASPRGLLLATCGHSPFGPSSPMALMFAPLKWDDRCLWHSPLKGAARQLALPARSAPPKAACRTNRARRAWSVSPSAVRG